MAFILQNNHYRAITVWILKIKSPELNKLQVKANKEAKEIFMIFQEIPVVTGILCLECILVQNSIQTLPNRSRVRYPRDFTHKNSAVPHEGFKKTHVLLMWIFITRTAKCNICPVQVSNHTFLSSEALITPAQTFPK